MSTAIVSHDVECVGWLPIAAHAGVAEFRLVYRHATGRLALGPTSPGFGTITARDNAACAAYAEAIAPTTPPSATLDYQGIEERR